MVHPAYPHPTPPGAVDRANPMPGDITGLPPFTKYMGDVAAWFSDMGVLPACQPLAIDQPGKVLVLASQLAHRSLRVNGHDVHCDGSAKVMNGHLPPAQGLHKRWVTEQSDVHLRDDHARVDEHGQAYWIGAPLECSQDGANGGGWAGYYDDEKQRIYINAHMDDGSVLVHEYLHTFDGTQPSPFPQALDEGLTDYFARDASSRFHLKYRGLTSYDVAYGAVKLLVNRVGISTVARLKFARPAAWLDVLSDRLNHLNRLIVKEQDRLSDPATHPYVKPRRSNPLGNTIAECIEQIAVTGETVLHWPAQREWEVKFAPKARI